MESDSADTGGGRSRLWPLVIKGLFAAGMACILVWPAWEWVPHRLAVPTGDGAAHLVRILSFQEQFLRAESLADWFRPLLTWMDDGAYPPLAHLLLGQLGALLGGLGLQGLALLNLGWVALTALAVYVLGRRIFGGTSQRPQDAQGRLVGFLAAFIVAFSPVTLGHVPSFLLDLPAAAMLLVALAAVACTVEMQRPLPACLAGAAVAGAGLTKWSTLFGLAPALVWVLVRVARELPRPERAVLLRALALLALTLLAGIRLALVFPPRLESAMRTMPAGYLATILAGLGAGCLLAVGLGGRRLRSKPARNLVLAICVTILLAGPFYLAHMDLISIRSRSEIERCQEPATLDSRWQRVQAPFFAEESFGLPMTALIAAGLTWLLAGGPRGGFALVGGPLLANASANVALNLCSPRYFLPGYPLEILAAFAWLLAIRGTRTAVLALLLCLGSWNAGMWLAGLTVATPLTADPEAAGLRGCGPASMNGRLALLTDAVAGIVGPGWHAVAVQVEPWPLSSVTLQAVSLAQGHSVLLRGMDMAQVELPKPAMTGAIRFAVLANPRCPPDKLLHLVRAPIQNLPGSWIVVMEPVSRPLRLPPVLAPRLGPPRPLPAPAGFRARIYLVR